MSGRRANSNRIRGPQSALTDFLAANNISAQQIRDTYEQRNRAAQEQNAVQASSEGDEENDSIQTRETPASNPKKRKQKDKKAAGKPKGRKSKKNSGSEDEFVDSEDDLSFIKRDMYKKSTRQPGQLENCDICDKRFTVTPYSKTGPEGGLLCTPCGKLQTKEQKKEAKPVQKSAGGRKRRQTESNRLDGLATYGAKSLEQLCVEKVADHHLDIEEFGDLPDNVLERLSEIFSKKRVFNPRTLKLFLRPDLKVITINDAAYIESDDYNQMLAVAPHIQKLVVRNACQFKDVNLAYLAEKATGITYLQFYASNLVTDAAWKSFFEQYGHRLETLKLQWLDASFDDEVVEHMIKHCPNLKRLKLKYCRRMTAQSLASISQLTGLEHLSLRISHPVQPEDLVAALAPLAPKLQTLSLENFEDADESVFEKIAGACSSLCKLRFTGLENVSEAAISKLFGQGSVVPPLRYVDLSCVRDVDHNNPQGQETDAIGFGADSFKALMHHSAGTLEILDIASCRHVSHAAFCDAFDGSHTYGALREVNLSFCGNVDTFVIRSLFACCPALQRVTAFGCFKVEDVAVPRGIALIGVPRAQDSIEQVGNANIDVLSALRLMGSTVPVSA